MLDYNLRSKKELAIGAILHTPSDLVDGIIWLGEEQFITVLRGSASISMLNHKVPREWVPFGDISAVGCFPPTRPILINGFAQFFICRREMTVKESKLVEALESSS